MGHVTWGGARLTQPSGLQALPIRLTLKSSSVEVNYPLQTTDASGFFTVSVAALPAGTYNWRVKDPKYLANGGSITLAGDPKTQYEMGFMRPGDSNNDNLVTAQHFIIMKNTFGRELGQFGYDDRADFNGDNKVTVIDFIQLKPYFGIQGAPPPAP